MTNELAAFVLREATERAVLLLDADGRVLFGVGRGARFGPEPVELTGRSLADFYPAAARKAGQPRRHLERAARDGGLRLRLECVGLDDRRFPAELVLERLPDGEAAEPRFAGLVVDTTEQQRAAHAGTALSEARTAARSAAAERDELSGIVQSIAQAVLVLDRDWRVVYMNEQAESLLRLARQELEGRDLRRKLGTTGTAGLFGAIERSMTDRVQVTAEEFYPLSGTWFEIQAYPGRRGVSVLFHDITERRQEREQLRLVTQYHPTTGLPNRALLRARLAQGVAHAHRFGQMLAVIVLELNVPPGAVDDDDDAFAELLTRTVASTIEPIIRQNDTLGQVGPHRWAIVQHLGQLDGAATLADKLLAAVATIPQLAEIRGGSTAAGIAILDTDGDTADDLLRAAEAALGATHASGAHAFCYANAALHYLVTGRITMRRELRAALERDEFRIFFQPEVDTLTGRTVGLEALFRWEHPHRGILNAGEFLPVAAGTDIILPLGEWALREVCAQARAWREAGRRGVRMSMNLTDAQLRSPDLPALIAALLGEFALPLDAVEVELTEAQLLRERTVVEEMCDRLHARGLTVCIDDFGGGFGPIGALVHPAVRKVKIDGALTARLDSDGVGADRMLAAIVQLTQILELQAVVKGVESDRQLTALQRHGCHVAQGYLVGRPVPAAQLSAEMRRG
jgi:PAS domain S-box-containing protein